MTAAGPVAAHSLGHSSAHHSQRGEQAVPAAPGVLGAGQRRHVWGQPLQAVVQKDAIFLVSVREAGSCLAAQAVSSDAHALSGHPSLTCRPLLLLMPALRRLHCRCAKEVPSGPARPIEPPSDAYYSVLWGKAGEKWSPTSRLGDWSWAGYMGA